MGRTLIDAGAQSTSAGAITAAQTTLSLATTANFGAPTVKAPTSVIILDTGNPSYLAASPLATPYEYQVISGNNSGTNVLTINNGVRAGYAGTTPKAFFAGATVAAVLLAEDLTLTMPMKFDAFTATNTSSVTLPTTGSFPATGYSDLEIRYWARGDQAGALQEVYVNVNGDTTANYGHQRMQATGTTQFDTDYAAVAENGWLQQYVSGGGAAANCVGFGRIWLPNYADTTTNKMMINNWGAWSIAGTLGSANGLNDGQNVGIFFGPAITSVTIKPAAGTFAKGQFSAWLYP